MSDDKDEGQSSQAQAIATIYRLSELLGVTVEDAASIYLKVSTALMHAMKAREKAN